MNIFCPFILLYFHKYITLPRHRPLHRSLFVKLQILFPLNVDQIVVLNVGNKVDQFLSMLDDARYI